MKEKHYICMMATLIFVMVIVLNLVFSDALAETSVVEIPETDFGHPVGGTWYVTPEPIQVENEYILEEQEKVSDYFIPIQDCEWSIETQKGIKKICDKYKISFPLIMSMAYEESRYDAAAVGDEGQAIGAWQIHPSVWMEVILKLGYSPEDMKKILPAAEVTCYSMRSHFERLDDAEFAVMAWNGGGAYAMSKVNSGQVSEYARKILERSQKWEGD